MKITAEQRQLIVESFQKMKSKEDLLSLLNIVKEMTTYGLRKKPSAFEMKHLNYHSNPKRHRYIKFSIPKKTGGERTIHAPEPGLKAMQRCMNLILQAIHTPHKAATGFVIGKSIVSNAKIHIGSHYVYNIDLKDFFPSVDQARFWGRLQYPPFNLNNDRLELASIISGMCFNEMEVERMDEKTGEWGKVRKSVLPQGAPTSPTITNIICERLDFYLTAVAKRFGLKYTRYADDITFSSAVNVFQNDSDFQKELNRIISEQNFHIRESKVRLQRTRYRQEVTGLIVNGKANVRKRYIKDLRKWLYLWEHYGYIRAEQIFIRDYFAYRGHLMQGKPNMENVIAGKLDYLKMVRGFNDSLYLQLAARFRQLLSKVKDQSIEAILIPSQAINVENRKEHLNQVLKLIIHKGLQSAMKYYKPNNT